MPVHYTVDFVQLFPGLLVMYRKEDFAGGATDYWRF